MPDTRAGSIESDAQELPDHWALDEKARSELLLQGRLMAVDLTDKDAMEACLNVDRLRYFKGSLEDAKRSVENYAARRENAMIDRLITTEANHSEATVIAFTPGGLKTADGIQVNVTARQGASEDDVILTTLTLVRAIRRLRSLGFETAGGGM